MKKIAACVSLVALFVVAMAMVSVRADEGDKSQTIKATLTSIAEDQKTMKCTDTADSDKSYTMNLTKSTKVIIDSENGKLTDLKKGDRLQCICTKTETANTFNCSEIRRNKADQK